MSEEPESMLSPLVQKILLDKLKEEMDKAIKENNNEILTELARARKLIRKGCWKIRKKNPYLDFMSECMLKRDKEGKLSLEDTQKAMQKCAKEWHKLPKEKKKGRKELDIYDYL